jgi:putative NADPH-quinone reductase
MSITPSPPGQAKEERFEHGSVLGGKTRAARVSSQWKSTANPVTVSFGATLHREVVKTLRSSMHEIDDCDLYAERFDPVLSEQERMQYHDLRLNRTHINTYANRLLAAEALILVYPVWNEGFPAILKGFFDRVSFPA